MAEVPAPEDYVASDSEYEQRVFSGGTRLTRWSHRNRSKAASLGLKGRTISRAVDVGGANGWYLRHLVTEGMTESGVVLDIDDTLLGQGRQESKGLSLEFTHSTPEVVEALKGSFDLVACLETLEHVEDTEAVLDDVLTLARPGGLLLVSVPVEVGPALLIKQAGRWAANRDGTYGYGRYPWKELVRAGVFWNTDGIDRINLHSHKGFDFRRARAQLRARATVTRTWYSPVRFCGPIAASTAFFLAQAPEK